MVDYEHTVAIYWNASNESNIFTLNFWKLQKWRNLIVITNLYNDNHCCRLIFDAVHL